MQFVLRRDDEYLAIENENMGLAHTLKFDCSINCGNNDTFSLIKNLMKDDIKTSKH